MARAAVGLTVSSTVIGSEGFRGNGHIADPINAGTTAASVADIGTSSTDITATAAALATARTDIGTSSTGITATAALLAADATALGTTDDTAVEASLAVLEADGASPTQAHVNDLRAIWNTMRTNLNTFETHSATATADASTLATRDTALGTQSTAATSDASTLATRSTALAADVAAVPTADDVVISYDIAAVGNRSVLKRAVNRLLAQIESTSDFAS